MRMFNVQNTACLLLMVAFVAGANWALGALLQSISFPAFMLFGLVTVALMIAGGFAWDRYEARRNQR